MRNGPIAAGGGASFRMRDTTAATCQNSPYQSQHAAKETSRSILELLGVSVLSTFHRTPCYLHNAGSGEVTVATRKEMVVDVGYPVSSIYLHVVRL
jgi:hypothetical protein